MATAFHPTVHDHLTIHFEDGGDGWIVARIEEEPAAISQGRTEEEAYVNVVEALRDLTHAPTASERVAHTVQARVIEPLTQLIRR
jgi:predicted RNase H-like HicB family nuclease